MTRDGLLFAAILLTSATVHADPQSATSTASSQQPSPATVNGVSRRTMVAVRIADSEEIILDGRLDESIWSRAVPAADFIQQDPNNGEPATEETEVRIIYDQDTLYMGVTCFDSEPDKWIGYQRRRDEFLPADDRFMWNIDTFNNQQSSYFFEMNPSGLMADALRATTGTNRQWDGIWNAKVHRSEIGWTIEIEIPFRTLSFDPTSEVWGINFQRTVRRKNEDSLWTGWARNQGLNRLANAGLVTGIREISKGKGLDLKPYLLGTSESSPGRGDDRVDNSGAVGLDVFYSPSPGLRTNLTINTDFAQTEVDQRLVNLTQFPQFFPEKRDFFLDGSTFFDFQSTAPIGNAPNSQQANNSLIPFFSRRIGLDAGGNPQQVDLGGKLAGQIGRTDVGALYVRTGREDTVFGEDFAVFRAKRRMLRQSYVGGLYTGRHTRDSGTRGLHTVGADFLLATSTFRGRQNLSVGGFFVNTTRVQGRGENNGFGVVVDYPNDPWSSSFFFREIQEHYNAAVGFTPRVGFRRWQQTLAYTRRPRQHRWMRSMQHGIDASVNLDTAENRLLNRDVDITLLNVNTHSQDSFQVHVVPTYERLEADFAISPGVTLPAGSDDQWNRYRFQVATAQRRVVAVSPTLELGTFYNGTRRKIAMDLNLRLRPGVIIYTSWEWNKVDLDEGSFRTRLYRVVPELQFSPWMAWVNNVQYDTQSRVVGWQSRFRWILKPGNDLYVVYTHNWLDDPLRSRPYTLDRRLASKVLYTHRF